MSEDRGSKRSRRREMERQLRRKWLFYWWVYCRECHKPLTKPHQVAFDHTQFRAVDGGLPGEPLTDRDNLPSIFMVDAQTEHRAKTGHHTHIVGGIEADDLSPDEIHAFLELGYKPGERL